MISTRSPGRKDAAKDSRAGGVLSDETLCYMKSSTTLFRILAVSAFAQIGLSAVAAEPAASSTNPTATAVSRPAASLINLDFPGGTVAELVATTAKTEGGTFNLIGEKADMAAELPPFSLRNAEPQALAVALDSLLKARGLEVGGSSNLFVLRKRSHPEAPAAPKNFVESFPLTSQLEFQSVDDIVDAIRMAWQLDPAHDPAALRLKFHPATKLLFVSGTGEAIGLAHSVIINLKQPPSPQAVATRPDKK